MSAPSAVNPVRVGIVTALEGTSVGENVFHEGEVPRRTDTDEKVVWPYIVLGTATEVKGPYHGQPGHDETIQIKCWAEDSWAAQELYAEAVGVLDGATLTIPGHLFVRSTVERLTDFPEPDPEVGGHVVIGRVSLRTLSQ